MPKLPELYIAVDVEADGPIPGLYRQTNVICLVLNDFVGLN